MNEKMENLIINILAFLSAGISYIFTILMLLNFANSILDWILFLVCGLIIDGTKWFSLITFFKHYKNGDYGSFAVYVILFVLFFTVSIVASISYSTYTISKQLYTIEIVQNENYKNISAQIDKAKMDIHSIESEKTIELDRINKELNELPLDYISVKKELSDRKVEMINFYDEKINILKLEIENKNIELSKIDNTPKENRKLIDNSSTHFFQTVANNTKLSVDNIIFIFAFVLGIIFDLPTVAITADRARKSKVEMESVEKVERIENAVEEKVERIIPQDIPQKVAYVENRNSIPLVKKENSIENSIIEKPVEEKREWRKVENENVEIPKVEKNNTGNKEFNYSKFVERMNSKNLDIKKVMYKDFKDLMAISSFYKCKDKYKMENNI